MQPIETSFDWDGIFAVTLAVLKFLFGVPTLSDAPDVKYPQLSQATESVVLRVADQATYQETVDVLDDRLKKLSHDFTLTEMKDGTVTVRARTYLDFSDFLARLVQPGRLEVRHGETLLLGPEHFAGGETWERGILIKLTPEGSRILADMTSRLQGETVSMTLDGMEIASPMIREPIKNGELLLSGAEPEKFQPLLLFLECGSLPSKVEISSF